MKPRSPDELSTIIRASTRPAAAPAGAYTVHVVAGADVGRSITLDAGSPARCLVGSGPACTLRLADRTVSRRHVALEVRADGLHLTDLGSTNGTRIGALRVVEAVLAGGEVVELGETALRVDAAADHPPEPHRGLEPVSYTHLTLPTN